METSKVSKGMGFVRLGYPCVNLTLKNAKVMRMVT
jgi:UV DNA damage endonuclease